MRKLFLVATKERRNAHHIFTHLKQEEHQLKPSKATFSEVLQSLADLPNDILNA